MATNEELLNIIQQCEEDLYITQQKMTAAQEELAAQSGPASEGDVLDEDGVMYLVTYVMKGHGGYQVFGKPCDEFGDIVSNKSKFIRLSKATKKAKKPKV